MKELWEINLPGKLMLLLVVGMWVYEYLTVPLG